MKSTNLLMRAMTAGAFALGAAAGPQIAAADDDNDAAGAPTGATATDAGTLARQDDQPPPPPPKPKKNLIVGVKVRYLALPKAMVEWFVERVPSSSNNVGIGADIAWRTANSEFSVGAVS